MKCYSAREKGTVIAHMSFCTFGYHEKGVAKLTICIFLVQSATIDVKKTIFDLCTDVTDSFVAVIEVSLAQIIITPFYFYCVVRCAHCTVLIILSGWKRLHQTA